MCACTCCVCACLHTRVSTLNLVPPSRPLQSHCHPPPSPHGFSRRTSLELHHHGGLPSDGPSLLGRLPVWLLEGLGRPPQDQACVTVLGTHSDPLGPQQHLTASSPTPPLRPPGPQVASETSARVSSPNQTQGKRSRRTDVVPAARAVPGRTPRSAPGSLTPRPPCPHPHPLGWRAHPAQEERRHWGFVCTLGPGAPASPCGRREQLLHNQTRVQAVRESRQRLTCFIPAHEVKFSPCTNYL